jgi:hypothetical protein
MPIQFRCKQCGRKVQAPDSAAGRRAKCPDCQSIMIVPGAVSDAEEVVEAEEVMPTQPAEGEAAGTYGLAAPPPQRDEPDRTPCPMCGELIAAGAAKCRYCGEVFDPALKRIEDKKKKRQYSDDDTDLSTGDWLLAILCSGIGCIMGIVYLIQGKPKGGKMLGVSLLFVLIWNVISFAIRTGLER